MRDFMHGNAQLHSNGLIVSWIQRRDVEIGPADRGPAHTVTTRLARQRIDGNSYAYELIWQVVAVAKVRLVEALVSG